MIGAALSWNRRREQYDTAVFGECVDEHRSLFAGKMLRNLHRNCQIKFSVKVYGLSNVSADEALAWDNQQVVSHVISIDARHVAYTDVKQCSHPRTDATSEVGHAFRITK